MFWVNEIRLTGQLDGIYRLRLRLHFVLSANEDFSFPRFCDLMVKLKD